jgi:hypothetical protein
MLTRRVLLRVKTLTRRSDIVDLFCIECLSPSWLRDLLCSQLQAGRALVTICPSQDGPCLPAPKVDAYIHLSFTSEPRLAAKNAN